MDGFMVSSEVLTRLQRRLSSLQAEALAGRPDGQQTEILGLVQDLDDFARALREREVRVKALLDELDDAARQREHELLDAVEEERHRIGRDLHDGIAQCLTGMAMQAKGTAVRLKRQGQEDWPLFDRFEVGLQSIAQDIRNIIQGLAPVELERGNLREAFLRRVVEPIKSGNVDIHLFFLQDSVIDDPQVGLHLLRIAQEAVHNSVKHAQATRIDISVIKKSGFIRLMIADNGLGLPALEIPARAGNGLRNMHYRARAIGAGLDVRSNIPAGLIVECTLQYPA